MALNNPKTYTLDWEGKKLSIETGRVAKHAHGAVVVRLEDTMVLVTAVSSDQQNPQPFLPLTVNYQEMNYAAGKFPGGFFKREGRPSEKEILTSRLIDRPLRPLFPDGYFFETQVIATVISADGIHPADIPAIIGASAALCISHVPFAGPIAGARVGRINGKFVLNPTVQELARSEMDAVIVIRDESVVMVEGGAQFVSEEVVVDALEFVKQKCQPVLELQRKIMAEVGKPKMTPPPPPQHDAELVKAVAEQFGAKLREAASVREKQARYAAYGEVKKAAVEALGIDADGNDRSNEVKAILEELKYSTVRKMIREGVRVDGRDHNTVRPIEIEVGWIPRAHGSALFTRGETQSIVAATLGSRENEQKVDSLDGEVWKRFYLHYNFPPFSVGEVRVLRSPGRREIGHGALAERALLPVIPDAETFPYTIRVVSDITESNGSSSMATVCGASLALMQAGVPIKSHVAGVAMGLIKEEGEFVILTDILGDEDHLGDMDFKVAGSAEGITSFQMDIKCDGVTREVMARALEQARIARLHILAEMNKAIAAPASSLSPHAPTITTIRIPQDRIGDVIGPGGKVIRAIVAETGAKIDIEEDGLVRIFATSQQAGNEAKRRIEQLTKEVQPGEYYVGTVRKIVDFGAFVEILPGVDGLVHISEIAEERIQSVSDVIKEGDRFVVLVLDVDPNSGKIRLSRKRALGKSIAEVEG